MGMKSEVLVLDVLMKNKAFHSDIIAIMNSMQEYLGEQHPTELMDGDTVKDRLGILEPVTEDWHCLVVVLLSVRIL